MIVIRKAALTLLLGAFFALFGSPQTAGAAPLRPTPGPQAGQCPDSANLRPGTVASDTSAADYLPINRWSGATSQFHTRLGSKAWDDMRQKVARDTITPMFLSLGNSMWQTSAGITEFAEGFEIANDLGCTADKTAAQLGNAVLGSGVLVLILCGAIFMAVKSRLSAAGDGRASKTLFKSVAVLGVFAGLLIAANRTAETNRIATGSPAWLITKTNSVVTDIADPIIKAAADQSPGVNGFSATNSIDPNEMSCTQYRAALHDAYTKELPTTSSSGGVPLVISAMWEQSGLRAWEISQFGARSPFSEYSSCRLLERVSGIPFNEQWTLLEATSSGLAAPSRKTLSGGDQTETDQRMIFFGACRWDGSTWSVATGLNGDPGWAGVSKGGPIDPQVCSAAWGDDDGLDDPFEWVDNPGDIEKRATGADKIGNGSEQVADYMYNLHGDSVTSAIGVSFAYFLTSLIVLIVLGVLAIGVIVAKVMLVVMAALSLLMIPWAAFSPDGVQKLVRFAKFALGAMIYSFGLQFILVLMTIITAFLAQVGFAVVGSGNIGSVIWTGISPILALILIKFLFTKVMHAPDPLKPATVAAFGGAMGGVGGAAIGGLFGRVGRQVAGPRGSGRQGSNGGSGGRTSGGRPTQEPRKRFATGDEQKEDEPSRGEKDTGRPRNGATGKSTKGDPKADSTARTGKPNKGMGTSGDSRPPKQATRQRNDPAGAGGDPKNTGRAPLLSRAVDRWDGSAKTRRRTGRVAAVAGATAWAGAGGIATLGAMAFTPLGGAVAAGAAAYYGRQYVQRHREQRHLYSDASSATADNARRAFEAEPNRRGFGDEPDRRGGGDRSGAGRPDRRPPDGERRAGTPNGPTPQPVSDRPHGANHESPQRQRDTRPEQPQRQPTDTRREPRSRPPR